MSVDLHRRRSIRLAGYDYSLDGWYFITICTHERIRFFGEIDREKMHLSDVGILVERLLQESAMRCQEIELDRWIVMPDHLHFIIRVVGAHAMRPGPWAHGMRSVQGAEIGRVFCCFV